jgi:hypothetical protein
MQTPARNPWLRLCPTVGAGHNQQRKKKWGHESAPENGHRQRCSAAPAEDNLGGERLKRRKPQMALGLRAEGECCTLYDGFGQGGEEVK